VHKQCLLYLEEVRHLQMFTTLCYDRSLTTIARDKRAVALFLALNRELAYGEHTVVSAELTTALSTALANARYLSGTEHLAAVTIITRAC
jgi:hypothetical protein